MRPCEQKLPTQVIFPVSRLYRLSFAISAAQKSHHVISASASSRWLEPMAALRIAANASER